MHHAARLPALLVCAALIAGCSTQSPVRPTDSANRLTASAAGFGSMSAAPLTTGATVNLASCLSGVRASNCMSIPRVSGARAVGALSIPNAPNNLVATASGGDVTLAWQAPAPAADPVVAYAIEAGSFPGAADLANFSTGNVATSFFASGVGSGTYYVRVRAISAGGPGAPSNEARLVVGGGPCVAPGPPGALTLISNSGGTVVLTWAPASGSPASYIIEAGSAPGLSNLANGDLGLTTTMTATGVGAGTYYVRVRARNACGASGPSNELTLVVGNATPTGPVVGANVDGVPWRAASITASFTNGRMTVGGTNPLWSVDFSLFPTGPGTYPIPAPGPSFAFVLSNSTLGPGRRVPEWQTADTPGVGGGGGSVTITSLTTTGASGTFAFTLGPYLLTGATGTKTVTDGVFNVSFR